MKKQTCCVVLFFLCVCDTVEHPVETTSAQQPVFQNPTSFHVKSLYLNLLYATTSLNDFYNFLELTVWNLLLLKPTVSDHLTDKREEMG